MAYQVLVSLVLIYGLDVINQFLERLYRDIFAFIIVASNNDL